MDSGQLLPIIGEDLDKLFFYMIIVFSFKVMFCTVLFL
jgi:hypothetical protein